MKIGIDVRTLETGHRFRGIGAYSQELLGAISRIDHKNNYVFFTQSQPSRASEIIIKNDFVYHDYLIHKVADTSRYYWAQDQYYFPYAIRKSQVDVIHILEQLSCPLIKTKKTIVTVHDLIQIMPIGNPSWKTKIKFSAIKKADKIIAISNSVKHDIIKFLGIPSQKIKVIYNGYDTSVFKPATDVKKLTQFRKNLLKGRSQKYLLYVGSFAQFEPRKNLNFLIDIFDELIRNGKSDLTLVMIGKSGAESNRLKALAKTKKIQKKIIFLDYIPNARIAPYFQAAEIFLFPSLYEGFGIPPLQAMACSTPTITANTTSLPEVVGKAGILLSPEKKSDWIKKIYEIENNSVLRKSITTKGLVQAKKFSWKKCAQETINTYKEVYDAKN